MVDDSERNDPKILAAQAVAIWRVVSRGALHGPGCSCCGAQPIKLAPSWLAEDIDHALRTRYAAQGRLDLLALLDSYAAGQGKDFAVRINALAQEGSHPTGVAQILRDVIDTLNSVGGASSGSRFTAQ